MTKNNDFSDVVVNAQIMLNDLDKVVEVSKAVNEVNENFVTTMNLIKVYLVNYFTIIKKNQEKENEYRN